MTNSLDGGAANRALPDRDLVELRAANVVSRGETSPCERSLDKETQ